MIKFNIHLNMDAYYTNYYEQQTGGGTGGDEFLQLKIPRVYQRGRGVGAIFSSLWRFLQPILKTGASYASKELLETGSDILSGIVNQKPLKNVLADRSIQIVDKIRDKTAEKINKMAGAGHKRKKKGMVQTIKGKKIQKTQHFLGFRHPEKNNNTSTQRKSKTNKFVKQERILDIFS